MSTETLGPRELRPLAASPLARRRKAGKRPATWTPNDAERPLERVLFASTKENIEARLDQYKTEPTGGPSGQLKPCGTLEACQTTYEAWSNTRIQSLEKEFKHLQALLAQSEPNTPQWSLKSSARIFPQAPGMHRETLHRPLSQATGRASGGPPLLHHKHLELQKLFLPTQVKCHRPHSLRIAEPL